MSDLYKICFYCNRLTDKKAKLLGFGALSGKMLLVRIVENNKMDAYFRAG